MNRQNRQTRLLEIIEEINVETQQELTSLLLKEGYKVTQATVSRDIQELGLLKVAGNGSRSRYVKPLDPKLQRLRTLFHQSVLSIDSTENFIVLKTLSGSANSAAMLIDNLENKEIMGTIAGDDTVLIIVKTKEGVNKIVKTLNDFLN
ncbi:MAG: arginine repressor [Clostridia bacterium]|nr:arginine repressor [Clostridia bacterium]